MKIKSNELLRLIGLATQEQSVRKDDPVLITGAATDPDSGLVVSLASKTDFNAQNTPSDIKIKYWRQLPQGQSRNQDLITIKTSDAKPKGNVNVDEIWVQSTCVYNSSEHDDTNPATRKKINRVLEGLNRLNTHLRDKGNVADTAKILAECYFDEVVGENLTIRGLKKEGGFEQRMSHLFMKNASNGKGVTFTDLDATMLKTILGFRINTLESTADYSTSRKVMGTDPQSGVSYEANVELKERKNGNLSMRMSIDLGNVPDEEIEARAIPELVNVEFKKNKDDSYTLLNAKLLGQKVEPDDTQTLMAMIGVAQESNNHIARWKYPTFMDSVAEFDLLDMVDPLQPPPSLKEEGGEFLYTSLHGSGFEKRVENFGDQIGLADLFLHRGTKEDGTVSTVGVAVDFPFASGGPDSNFDGAVPDYMAFWKDTKAFLITHDHYDHCDGLPFYAKAGLMKEKDVYATKEVKYMLDKKMDFLKVPRRLRPKITVIEDETPFAIRDDEGNARVWVQPCPNGTSHSALCTPYLLTGCYGDEHYKGSVAVYGDGNGLNENAIKFFEKGTRALGELPEVTAEKVDRDIDVVLHDITSSSTEGRSPTQDEVEANLAEVMSWFPDKGILMTPISTNNSEYVAGVNVAHTTGRDITAVGRNAELRMACKNLFGMLHDFNLRDFKLNPFEEADKGEDSLIPQDVLDIYFDFLDEVQEKLNEHGVVEADLEEMDYQLDQMDFDAEDPDAYEQAYAKAHELALETAREELENRVRNNAKQRAMKAVKEKLDPIERVHEKSVRRFMLNSLFTHDAVVFENDINDYLMYLAVTEGKDEASIRATRTSKLGKSFRMDPEKLMIFITGTQGNAEERFSTLQKFADFFSLLDVDESVRSTGYKINAEDFVPVITQPAIPGNENGQTDLVDDLVANRDVTVVGAFKEGFVIHNPKEKRNFIMKRLKELGWEGQPDSEGNIHVYGVPIHRHGHGFKEDLLDIAKAIPAKFHECHHTPNKDAYMDFRNLMRDNGFNHSGTEPDDFQVMSVNSHGETNKEKYKRVAQLNPSYVLVKMSRKYGQYFGGWLQLIRTTMLRREGSHRADGLMARTTGDGVYQKKTARQSWEHVTNPERRSPVQRARKLGPSRVDRGQGVGRHRSRSTWSTTPPDLDLEA